MIVLHRCKSNGETTECVIAGDGAFGVWNVTRRQWEHVLTEDGMLHELRHRNGRLTADGAQWLGKHLEN